MDTYATQVIASFGGTTTVSRLTGAPTSTVHSWKHNGIPPSRLSHLRLIAQVQGPAIDWDTGLVAAPAEMREAS